VRGGDVPRFAPMLKKLPGFMSSRPALASDSSKGFTLLLEGGDSSIHVYGASWSDWKLLSGPTAKGPAVAAFLGGKLHLKLLNHTVNLLR